jgi:hypothetical protein
MFNFRSKTEGGPAERRLTEAVSAARSAPAGGLSDRCRAAILAATLDRPARPERLVPLFFPARQLIVAGLVPAMLVTVGVLMSRPESGEAGGHAAPEIRVAKQGQEIVFTIADGIGPHRVYKSTDPDRFDRSGAIPVRNNRFVDSAAAGPDLIFYRID